jgi:hypothetical protein
MTDATPDPEVEEPDPVADVPVEEPDPVEEPPAEEPAEEDDGSVQDVAHGFYWVRSGDTASAAAERIYGSADPSKLTPTNPPTPGFGTGGHLIRAIDVPGRITTVRAGENAEAVLKRLGVSAGKKNLSKFHAFNGGDGRVLRTGNLVFFPGGS